MTNFVAVTTLKPNGADELTYVNPDHIVRMTLSEVVDQRTGIETYMFLVNGQKLNVKETIQNIAVWAKKE